METGRTLRGSANLVFDATDAVTNIVEGMYRNITATLSKQSGEPLGRLLGDGLVHPSSATGRHSDSARDLAIPEHCTKILYDLGHLGLLRDTRVLDQFRDWLSE